MRGHIFRARVERQGAIRHGLGCNGPGAKRHHFRYGLFRETLPPNSASDGLGLIALGMRRAEVIMNTTQFVVVGEVERLAVVNSATRSDTQGL